MASPRQPGSVMKVKHLKVLPGRVGGEVHNCQLRDSWPCKHLDHYGAVYDIHWAQQRQKYLENPQTLLAGKFLHARKVFERRSYLRPTAAILVQHFRKISNLSRNFPESESFLDCLESFLFIWKVSRQTVNLPD